MKEEYEGEKDIISALSFERLLSVSKIMRDGIRYGKYCCLKEVDTATDRDIFKYPIRINAYILVVCSEGMIELTYNLYQIKLKGNSMFLYNPDTIVRLNAIEPSKLSILVFTREFINDIGIKFENVPLQYRIVRERQTFSLSPATCGELRTMMRLTSDFIRLDKSNTYYNEMVRTSFKAFIYRALYEINNQFGSPLENNFLPTQGNNHFDRFMSLLQDNYMKQHYIKFYSDKMNLTPKYLSMMIKRISGKLATEWIDEYVILEAKNLIKYSNMSIQEIAYMLNFPNQSFFGKYFKRHTGLSPKAYRQQQ